ncbi:MAG: hypothetical protein AB7G28_04950 [Pirellulales bacterium]
MKLGGRFACFAVAVAIVLALGANLSWAQPGGGGFRGRGGPGGPGGFFGGGGTFGLIQQQEVQQEIELSEEQQTQLQSLGEEIRNQIRNEMQGMFDGMRDLSDEERQARFDEIRTKFEQINKDAEGRMQKVLMPHQFDRLKQIDVQSRLQRGGAAALTEGELADTLGLTEAQRDQIREKQEQVQKDLDEKIGQLRIEARNQLLEVLTPEQRAKLEGMMGSAFALPEPQFGPPGGRGGRGFGRGGRGGGNRDRANAPASADQGT